MTSSSENEGVRVTLSAAARAVLDGLPGETYREKVDRLAAEAALWREHRDQVAFHLRDAVVDDVRCGRMESAAANAAALDRALAS